MALGSGGGGVENLYTSGLVIMTAPSLETVYSKPSTPVCSEWELTAPSCAQSGFSTPPRHLKAKPAYKENFGFNLNELK